MNREILFRGKKIDNGEWIYGNYEWYHKPQKHIISNPYTGETKGVLPETIGQFTGLTDKNGAKIFEGDVLGDEEFYSQYDKKYYGAMRVMYARIGYDGRAGLAGFMTGTGTQADYNTGEKFICCDRGINLSRIKVIGNIYDNPELLEENDCKSDV